MHFSYTFRFPVLPIPVASFAGAHQGTKPFMVLQFYMQIPSFCCCCLFVFVFVCFFFFKGRGSYFPASRGLFPWYSAGKTPEGDLIGIIHREKWIIIVCIIPRTDKKKKKNRQHCLVKLDCSATFFGDIPKLLVISYLTKS